MPFYYSPGYSLVSIQGAKMNLKYKPFKETPSISKTYDLEKAKSYR